MGFGGVKFNKIFAFFAKKLVVSIKKKRTNRSMFALFCSCSSPLGFGLDAPLIACALAADYGCSAYFATFFPPTI